MLQTRIRRGQLDREVTFLKPVYGDSDSNEDKIESWTEVTTDHTVWALKKDLAGRDMLEAERPTYLQRTSFIVDYRTDITSVNRLYCEGKVYEILAVTEHESERQRYIVVMCNLLDNELWT